MFKCSDKLIKKYRNKIKKQYKDSKDLDIDKKQDETIWQYKKLICK